MRGNAGKGHFSLVSATRAGLPQARAAVPPRRREVVIEGQRFWLIPVDTTHGDGASLAEGISEASSRVDEAATVRRGSEVSCVTARRLLTTRELEIVSLVASGFVNKQIAAQLCISEWTVSTHLRRVFAKLKVDTRAAMVANVFGRAAARD